MLTEFFSLCGIPATRHTFSGQQCTPILMFFMMMIVQLQLYPYRPPSNGIGYCHLLDIQEGLGQTSYLVRNEMRR